MVTPIATIVDRELRLQAKALDDPIMITNRQGLIAWVNPAFTALTGFTQEDAIGKNPRQLINSGLHDRDFFRRLWATILDGRIWRGETLNRRKDGTIYAEWQTITPVKSASGEITYFVSVKRPLSGDDIARPSDVARPVRMPTVLIVEDEHEARDLAARVLRAAGYEVLAAGRAADALLLLEYHRGRVDVLFTDLELPDMSGQELARRLAVDRPALRLLFTSGQDAGHLGVNAPATVFLAKPYGLSELVRKVQEVLDTQPAKVA